MYICFGSCGQATCRVGCVGDPTFMGNGPPHQHIRSMREPLIFL